MWDVFHIHTCICGEPPHYQNRPIFQKASLNNHDHKNQNEAQVFLYHCISEGTLSLENVQCHFHFILHVKAVLCLIKQRLYAQLTAQQPLPRKHLKLVLPL